MPSAVRAEDTVVIDAEAGCGQALAGGADRTAAMRRGRFAAKCEPLRGVGGDSGRGRPHAREWTPI